MYIKKNTVFSYFDEETGEERQYSVNEILSEEEYRERMYAVAPLPNLLRKTTRNVKNWGNEFMGTNYAVLTGKVPEKFTKGLASKRALELKKQGITDPTFNPYRQVYTGKSKVNYVDFGGLGNGLPN